MCQSIYVAFFLETHAKQLGLKENLHTSAGLDGQTETCLTRVCHLLVCFS